MQVKPEGEQAAPAGQAGDSGIREQDRFLPIANIARIMKKAIPDNAKIAKDAKETVQECVSEFISFITSEASERCTAERRKTINGEDIIFAMQNLGFDAYIEPLQQYLKKFREDAKANDAKNKVLSLSVLLQPFCRRAPLMRGFLSCVESD